MYKAVVLVTSLVLSVSSLAGERERPMSRRGPGENRATVDLRSERADQLRLHILRYLDVDGDQSYAESFLGGGPKVVVPDQIIQELLISNEMGEARAPDEGRRLFNAVKSILQNDFRQFGADPAYALFSNHFLVSALLRGHIRNLREENEFSFHCFTCQMEVLTPKGYERIDRIKPGDEVYSWDESRRSLVLNKVTNIHEKNDEPYGTLFADNATLAPLEVTGGHPFLLPEKAKYLEVGDIAASDELRGVDWLKGAHCDAILVKRGSYPTTGIGRVMTLSVKKAPHNFIIRGPGKGGTSPGIVVHNKTVT